MKNKLAMIVALILTMSLISCEGSYDYFDTTHRFDYAIISLPNGEIVEGAVESWRDFEDGDQLQIKIGGDVYLVHSEDAVLIKKGAEQ